jgi:hypothetical protein
MTQMPDAQDPKTPPGLQEILRACQPGASDELRRSIIERLGNTEPLDEAVAGARDFLSAHGNDFDALRSFLKGPSSSVRRRRVRRIAATVSVAASLVLASLLVFQYRSALQRQRIMGELLFTENGLPVFASLDGDRDFHEMMSAYRMGEVEDGLKLLGSLESRHLASNDTLSYFGGWLHYMDRDYEKSAARFSSAAADSPSVFRDKARLMHAATMCLDGKLTEARRMLEELGSDSAYPYRPEAESILGEQRLWGRAAATDEKSRQTNQAMQERKIVRVVKGRVELRRETGSLIRIIGNDDSVYADLNEAGTMVLVTRANGKVELRSEGGSLIRNIGNGDASSARFQGADILIQTKKGKTELRREGGSLIRTF